MGNQNAGMDAERYRNGYPGLEQQESSTAIANLEFYTGKIASAPDGDFIDNIHTSWKGEYDRLEVHHGYIQWLFPIREPGMNPESQPLTKNEITQLNQDPAAQERILKSYDLILDFWGFKLVDHKTGEVTRGENWQACFDNLNSSGHNYLRITRVLKCLGEFNLEHLKKPWLQIMMKETFKEHTLANCRNSFRDYWIPMLRDDIERAELEAQIKEYMPDDGKDDNGLPE